MSRAHMSSSAALSTPAMPEATIVTSGVSATAAAVAEATTMPATNTGEAPLARAARAHRVPAELRWTTVRPATSCGSATISPGELPRWKPSGLMPLTSPINTESGIDAVANPSGEFVWKDSYVFVVDCEADRVLANPAFPERVGGDIKQHTDYAGYRYGLALCDTASKPDGGWVDYVWLRPGEDTPTRKSSYVRSVPGTTYQVGAGIYGERMAPEELDY